MFSFIELKNVGYKMSVENSLSRLSSALKKLEKVNASRPATQGGLRGQQDLFSAPDMPAEQTQALLKKIDHTIATVETLLQEERA